jgi:hypothetical protein
MASVYFTINGLIFAIMTIAETIVPSKTKTKMLWFSGMAVFNFLAAMVMWRTSL